jgi:hypothetical protein
VADTKIVDGVVISNKTIHSMVAFIEKSIFIKLDMSKAYDRVKWSLLHKVLIAFGFSQEWIMWVMSCVMTTFFWF